MLLGWAVDLSEFIFTMSSDSEGGIFLTQSTFSQLTNSKDTDSVLSDVLSLEELENVPKMDFTVKNDLFSDISENEMEQITQEINFVEQQESSRFGAPLQDGDLENVLKKGLCQNTENKTKWAMKVLENWLKQRQRQSEGNNTIRSFGDNVMDFSLCDLNEALSYFVVEVRNKDGGEYRPNTVYELIICIQHHFRTNGRFLNFLDDAEFSGLRNILDAKMKNLSKQGLGVNKKQAQVITEEQEEYMWKNKILGEDTPQKLLDTLLYQLGLNFALRAASEHRHLRYGHLSQINLSTDVDGKKYLEYREDVSKTNAGGILHRKVAPKVTRCYENTVYPDRCPVRIYQRYISLRPKNGKCDALYLRPRKYPLTDCWFSDSPVGIHQLQQTVARLCRTAGFSGFFTNHSLRATAATRLYAAGLDEQLVAEKLATGHQQLDHINVPIISSLCMSVQYYKETVPPHLPRKLKCYVNNRKTPFLQAGESSTYRLRTCVSI